MRAEFGGDRHGFKHRSRLASWGHGFLSNADLQAITLAGTSAGFETTYRFLRFDQRRSIVDLRSAQATGFGRT